MVVTGRHPWQPCALLEQLWSRLGEDMGEQLVGIYLRVFVHSLAQPVGECFGLLPCGADLLVGQDASCGEVGLQPPDRVSGLPGRNFGGVAVARSVVSVGVCLDAIRVRFHQERRAVRTSGLHRVAKHGEYGYQVVAVDLLAANPIPNTLVRKRRGRSLLRQRY